MTTASDHVEFWESRYRTATTSWDRGGPCAALQAWLETRPGGGRVLVVGCGRGHDALALARHGYDVTAIDFAPLAIAEANALAGDRPGLRFLLQDLFDLGPEFREAFDLIFEHTCLCATPHARWPQYAESVAMALKPGGLLVGAFFTGFDPDGPPFGIDSEQLERLLHPAFKRIEWRPVPGEPEHLGVFERLPASARETASPLH